jgi:hypothetical protein
LFAGIALPLAAFGVYALVALIAAGLASVLPARRATHTDLWRQLGEATSRAGFPCRQSKPGHGATNGSDPGKKWPSHLAALRVE